MKSLFLVKLIVAIFFFSCNSATETTEAEEEINEAGLKKENEIEQVSVGLSNENKENTFDLNEILAVFNKGGILSQKYHPVFNLETSDYEEEFNIFMKPKKIDGFYITALSFVSALERDDAYLDYYVLFYTLKHKIRLV